MVDCDGEDVYLVWINSAIVVARKKCRAASQALAPHSFLLSTICSLLPFLHPDLHRHSTSTNNIGRISTNPHYPPCHLPIWSINLHIRGMRGSRLLLTAGRQNDRSETLCHAEHICIHIHLAGSLDGPDILHCECRLSPA